MNSPRNKEWIHPRNEPMIAPQGSREVRAPEHATCLGYMPGTRHVPRIKHRKHCIVLIKTLCKRTEYEKHFPCKPLHDKPRALEESTTQLFKDTLHIQH